MTGLPAVEEDSTPLLQVKDLHKHFRRRGGLTFGHSDVVPAVDGVSFAIKAGETFGLVGESGCGKSTLGRVLLNLLPPTSGTVLFEGEDMGRLPPREMREMRKRMQIVFQDPYSSLNPRMTVGDTISEGLRVRGITDRVGMEKALANLLNAVGMSPTHIHVYPHKLSGGQRQRVAIARALAVGPKFIVADEPVSALDLSIQAQILNLMADLQEEFGLTYLFISHDLNVVRYLADHVAVMYLGKIVELAAAEHLFDHPLHPYTQTLLAAVPSIERTNQVAAAAEFSELPSSATRPSGCHFHPRCPIAVNLCSEEAPTLRELASEHLVACHRHERAMDSS